MSLCIFFYAELLCQHKKWNLNEIRIIRYGRWLSDASRTADDEVLSSISEGKWW